MAKEYIYIRPEAVWESIVSDVFTFICICGTVWFNENFCGGSYFLNGFALCALLISALAKKNKITMTADEAAEFIVNQGKVRT